MQWVYLEGVCFLSLALLAIMQSQGPEEIVDNQVVGSFPQVVGSFHREKKFSDGVTLGAN